MCTYSHIYLYHFLSGNYYGMFRQPLWQSEIVQGND